MLLAGLTGAYARRRRGIRLGLLSASGMTGAAALAAAAWLGGVPQTPAFFGAGGLLLLSFAAGSAVLFTGAPRRALPKPGWRGYLFLAGRNAGYRPGRSTLCVLLIALAVFVISSVESFRRQPESTSLDPESGTGGYALVADSVQPVVQDLNLPEGRDALGFSPGNSSTFTGVHIDALRVRPGDDASCRNLYAPREPRILGVPDSLLRSGRFSFRDSLTGTPGEADPWLLLEAPQPGGIPAIADATTLDYVLHRRLGDVITLSNASGAPVRLRIVAALRDSVLQGSLLISERRFLEAFPEQQGYRKFMIAVPENRASEVAQALERTLGDWGFDVTSTRDVLAAFHEVENTYLSTFQFLGVLGLVLGTVGLGAILLRNVLERRHEIALLRAVGYRRAVLLSIVAAENIFLTLLGLAAGTVAALLAVAPALALRGGTAPVGSLGLTLGLVLLSAAAASLAAAAAALRSPLLAALRSE